jgi:hypothetical protein
MGIPIRKLRDGWGTRCVVAVQKLSEAGAELGQEL